jgi:hypothetical protein
LKAYRKAQTARGEFVEPDAFAAPLVLMFNMTFWSVYTWANVYHFGTPFAALCVH